MDSTQTADSSVVVGMNLDKQSNIDHLRLVGAAASPSPSEP
jgi:hypothetical protein